MAEEVECAVIGAGAVGLAIARALALAGHEVVILEAAGGIGTGVSSRSSEVIHAGMYYPAGSLKAEFCVAGNRMLRDFLASRGVPFRMVGKLIVAADVKEEGTLDKILALGEANGVTGLRRVSAEWAMGEEPALSCVAALHSPDTGIFDTHAYMLALLGEAESHGAALAVNAPVEGGEVLGDEGVALDVGGAEPMRLVCKRVVNSAGLGAQKAAAAISGIPEESIAPLHYCKGTYFGIAGRQPFARLVYPVPEQGGLGVHYTMDMGGQGRFGPDTEWTESEDYDVDPARGDRFYAAVRRYWPGLADHALHPAYAGVRPKVQTPDGPFRDFEIVGPERHGVPGLVNLFGIESPGLTSSLAIAAHVEELLQ